jgi:protein SCO1/2
VESLIDDPNQHAELIKLLGEDHAVYDQRGTATVNRMRGWILLALARKELPEAALPFVLEELDTGVDAYVVAAAAAALRTYPERNPAFAPFLVRAISNIRYRDDNISLEAYGGFAVGAAGTSPVRELLETLVWLGPSARAVMSDLTTLGEGPTALSKKYQPHLTLALKAIGGVASVEEDCCQLPDGVRKLFSSVRESRTSTEQLDSTLFEDQDGTSLTFREFFHGRPSIVVFFYTRCDNPLKCSLTITKLARIQALLKTEGIADQINTAGITYDPGFDLPERIRNYGRHRGVEFASQHRLLRAPEGVDSVRKHFKLGVNFIESLVNRHRIEVYLLDREGQLAGSFERIQWNESEVVARARELVTENENRNASGVTRTNIASPVLGSSVALALALFPKCPLCWAAYMSFFGIAGLGSIPYSPWLQPVLAILLLVNLGSIWFRSRSTGRMTPFYVASVGAVSLIAAKAFAGLDPLGTAGVVCTLTGSIWSTIAATNRRQLARQ